MKNASSYQQAKMQYRTSSTLLGTYFFLNFEFRLKGSHDIAFFAVITVKILLKAEFIIGRLVMKGMYFSIFFTAEKMSNRR